MSQRPRRFSNFIGGGIAALAIFAALTALTASLLSLPSSAFGRGLAVMSAKLNSLGLSADAATQHSQPEPSPEPPPKLSSRLASELIRMSGFGGWDIEAAPEEAELVEDIDESPTEENSLEYPEKIESRDGKIIRKTYSYRTSDTYLKLPDGGLLRNCTDIDSAYLLEQCARKPDFSVNTDEPLVLIMHTHTTESYEPYQRDFYDESFSCRTTDLDKSVVAVGEKIAEQLAAAGISVIHDKTVHDYPRYTGAYDRSAVTVAGYLRDYPSIAIVLDVHRDAIEEDGVRYAPTVEVDGKSAAQVMIISGCKNVPQYRYNLRIASRLQSQMENAYPGLTRPILFDERNYNQEMTHGSFLLEMGSSANSLDEALYSGELVGKSLAEVIAGLRDEG